MPDLVNKEFSTNIQKAVDNGLLLCYIYSMVGGLEAIRKKERENRLSNFKKQFVEVEKWAEKYRIEVLEGSGFEDRFEASERKIYINSRLGAEAKYYTLLHECGHVLIDNNWKAFDRDNPMYASSCDLRVAKSKAYRVSIIAEEIEAWKRGRRLAKKLGHAVDSEKFDKMISENVMTYIDWASTGGGEL